MSNHIAHSKSASNAWRGATVAVKIIDILDEEIILAYPTNPELNQ